MGQRRFVRRHRYELITKDIEDKANEAVVGCERQQNLINKYNMLEVVDDALAVEEVHGRAEPVPVETLGGAQIAGAARDVGNGDDFLEGDDLDGGDNEDDVDVAHEEGEEEAGNHDEGPEGTRPEVGLLLGVLGGLLLFGRGLLGSDQLGFAMSICRCVRTSSTGARLMGAFCVGEDPSSLMSLKLERRLSEPLARERRLDLEPAISRARSVADV